LVLFIYSRYRVVELTVLVMLVIVLVLGLPTPYNSTTSVGVFCNGTTHHSEEMSKALHLHHNHHLKQICTQVAEVVPFLLSMLVADFDQQRPLLNSTIHLQSLQDKVIPPMLLPFPGYLSTNLSINLT